MTKLPRVVEVSWIDSSSHADWDTLHEHQRKSEQDDAIEHHSVGFVISKNRYSITIVQSFAPGADGADTMVGDALRVPRAQITRLRNLT